MATPRDSKSTGWIYIKHEICISVIVVFKLLQYIAAYMLHLFVGVFSFWIKICYHFWEKCTLSPTGISHRTSGEGWLWNCCFPQQQNDAELLLWEASTPRAQLLLSLELSRRKGQVTLLLTSQRFSFLDAVSFCVLPEVLISCPAAIITAAWPAFLFGRECPWSSDLVQRWENL